MKEQEFDIYVRNLLKDAQESVPPQVWEGVEAGLRRRKLILLWRRSAIGVAAAAAVVAAFVLLRPFMPVTEEHSQPTQSIFMAESSEPIVPETLPAVTEQVPQEVPLQQQLAGKKARVAQTVLPEAPVPEVPVPETIPETEPEPVSEVVPEVVPEPGHLQLSLLSAKKEKPRGGFSFTASGDFQGKYRKELGPGRMPQQWGLPPALNAAKEGIYNASPEKHFSLPISAGVGLTYHFSPAWAVGTGVRYTFMGRTFIGDYVSGDGFVITGTDIDNLQHWLGIPVNVYFNFLNHGRWTMHAFAGGAVEFLVRNDYLVHNATKDIHYLEKSVRPQWSAQLGVGVEFSLSPVVRLYLDPKLDYYFGTQYQPRSLRTIQPLRFEVEAGLRFSLGKQH